VAFGRFAQHFTAVLPQLIDTLLVLGAAQGLFLAVVLATKRTNSTANKLLAVAMLAFSLFVVRSLYYERGYYLTYPGFIGFSVALVFVFGPILYLYAKVVSEGGHTFRRRWLLHFVPAGLVTLYFVPVYSQSGPQKLAYLERIVRDGPPADLALMMNLQYPHGLTYVALTILLLRRHRARLRETYSNIDRINLDWLRNLTVGIVAVWGLATALRLLEMVGITTPLDATLTPVAVSVFVYAIGYFGLKQPEIFHPTRIAPEPAQPSAVVEAVDKSVAYEKSGLTPQQAESHLKRLIALMEEKELYKNSLLTLPELADELRISQHHLSEVINTQLGKNFYDFVNGYRVEEVMRRMRDPRSSQLTILAIALESGFNTKSSFNTFFKKYAGVTPSQFRGQEVAWTP
jgi:AraC-like DNA-binding protein